MENKIFIFGMKNCKYCKVQKKSFSSVFTKKEWTYIDVLDDDNIELALEIDIDNLPSTIIVGEDNKIVFKKEGLTSPDDIFRFFVKNEKSIPVSSLRYNKVLLSYDPKINNGDNIDVCNYKGELLCKANVSNCKKYSIAEKIPTVTANQKKAYLSNGGRRDSVWLLQFKKAKVNAE